MDPWLEDNIQTWKEGDCTVYAMTTEGSVIKTLFDVYQKQMTTNHIEYNERGIFSQQKNSRENMLFDLALHRESFENYSCSKPIWVGLNAGDFASFYHNVKKKEAIEMGIPLSSEDNQLLGVIPMEGVGGRRKSGYIRNQKVQYQHIRTPDGYGDPILIKGTDFQKCVKDMSRTTNNTSREVIVRGGNRWITFWGDAKGVQGSGVTFGIMGQELFRDTYDCASLSSIAKAGSMGNAGSKVKIYAGDGLPLRLEFPVGTLGTLNIYIKSHELISKEEEEHGETDDEGDNDETDTDDDNTTINSNYSGKLSEPTNPPPEGNSEYYSQSDDSSASESEDGGGSMDGGSDGGSGDGGSDDGGSDDSGSDDGGSEDGGSDGGSEDGGSEDGGSEDGGSEDGGSEDGGSGDGGSGDGGSDDNRNEDGGSDDNRNEDGGSDDNRNEDGGIKRVGQFISNNGIKRVGQFISNNGIKRIGEFRPSKNIDFPKTK